MRGGLRPSLCGCALVCVVRRLIRVEGRLSGRHLLFCFDFALQFLEPLERFAGTLLDERLVVGQHGEPVVEVRSRVLEDSRGEQSSFVEADAGEQFGDQFLLGVLFRAEAVFRVSATLLERVTDFVEERCVVLLHALERFLLRHPDAVSGRRVVSRVTAVRDGAGVERGEFLSGLHGREVDDLVRSLEVREVALVHGEHSIVASEQEGVSLRTSDLRLLLVFDLSEVGDGQTLRASLQLTAESLDLVEGEVVVVRAEERQREGIHTAVRLTAHAVLRVDGDPRLLPRGDAVLEALDESVGDDIGDSYFGGLAHLVWFGL